MTASFDHLGISVPDLEAGVAWYSAALRLTVERTFAVPGTGLRGVMLRHASGYRIELLHRPDAEPGLVADGPVQAAGRLGYGHLCLAVDTPDEVDAEFARLVAAGAGVRMSPRPAPRPGARMAFVADPYGNLIELIDRTV
ncbi:VOC family protein [Streptomyces asoensis]|uniref:VOC family protein n=1 Tax=Streptomyces asoensis TaxID=249586 RepID=A0A6M4WGV9_9ACTN|nr:VOC family protein [Streptomyces asoensis]QJS99789.1 VOC family protein [Streptomyces asoensis]